MVDLTRVKLDAWKNISDVIRLAFKDVLKRLEAEERRNDALMRKVDDLNGQLEQTVRKLCNELIRKWKVI